jgi:serine protease Do
VSVKIGVMPGDDKLAKASSHKQVEDSLASLGLTVAPAEDGAGLRVTAVDPDGAAAARGLKEGDVILEVAGREVHDPADVEAAVKNTGGKRVLMLVRSGDSQRFLALPVGKG